MLPALRQSLAVARHAFVLATPWSPPAWMKTNGILGNPANVPGWLNPADYGVMAQYFVKFLRAYAAAGVHVNAITAQNEPGQLTAYPGMSMTETNEANFIADALAPALHAAGLSTGIYGYDNNWYNVGVQVAHQLERGPRRARTSPGSPRTVISGCQPWSRPCTPRTPGSTRSSRSAHRATCRSPPRRS